MVLTMKQTRFIDEYLANGGRAKDAAVMAGYSESSAKQRGYELLRRPEVAAVIACGTLCLKELEAGRHGS